MQTNLSKKSKHKGFWYFIGNILLTIVSVVIVLTLLAMAFMLAW